jgi:predicted small lipoprotein YifL
MRVALLSLVLLAACGADGPPEPPAAQAPVSGVSITGDARVGVVVTD